MRKTTSLADRYADRVIKSEDPDACWDWRGGHHRHGYGTIGEGGRYGRDLVAHRVSYELHCGPIPKGLRVLHSCDNPPCTNPRHLRLGTQADNVRDMDEKGRRVSSVRIGAAHHGAKLSDAEVVEIRARHAAGGVKGAELATEYGVSQTAISRIVLRRSWRHLC